jgi:hexosaminidase
MMPPLIPEPTEITVGDEYFDLGGDVAIVLGSDSLFAAHQLQEAIRDASGLVLQVRKLSGPTTSRAIHLGIVPEVSHAEGYRLDITSDRVVIGGGSEAGVFYGVQTLKQLLKTHGARIPVLQINDAPVLAHRGIMLDVSRGKVPTLQALRMLVDLMASLKLNHLQLYVEHTFDFPSHPRIGAGCDPLTTDDILQLDAYCRARHVELVPNLQSFGHQRHMLAMPEYRELDEVGWRWSLTPAREETYQLLDELYADFLPNVASGWLNVDCDETWDLATGQSRPLADSIGKGRVYLQHILRLRDLAAKYGRRIMLWADVLHHYPELMPELPEDVLLLDWTYEAADRYPTVEPLGKSGRNFLVCPGTSTWNTLFPRLDNAVDNIRQYVRDGLDAGASGMLLTDWGDYGHYMPLTLSWYSYAFGAATGWTGARTTEEDFDAAFAPLFLQQPTIDPSLAAMRRLGRAVSAPTVGIPNRSRMAVALFDDALVGGRTRSVEEDWLSEVKAAAEEAVSAFATLPDAALRQDYGFMARLVAFAATRAQHSRLDDPAEKLAALTRDRTTLAALRSEFEVCWLRHARRSEIHLTLAHFDAADRAYASAIAWLDAGREAGAYTPEPITPLWEQGSAELRKLAEVAGAETLPPEVQAWLAQPRPPNA